MAEAAPPDPAPAPAPSRPRPDPARLGAAALALAQVPWIWMGVVQFRAGKTGLGGWVLASLLVVSTIAFMAWRDRTSRACGRASAVAWFCALLGAFFAYKTGFFLLWASAGLCASAAMLLSSARGRAVPARTGKPAGPQEPDNFGHWAKENLEAIIVAFVMALVIRCFCIEVFKIPSSSMEPTLLGDRHSNTCPFPDYHVDDGGDRIMVTKYYYALGNVERYDVVVFKFPLNQARNFIKRVVGLPNETLRIHQGDLYTRPKGGTQFTIARRPLRIQDSVWIDLAPRDPKSPRGFLTDLATFEDSWKPSPTSGPRAAFEIQDGELRTRESAGERSMQFLYRKPVEQGGTRVSDVRLAFDLEITSPHGEFFVNLENDHGRFDVRMSTEQECSLSWHEPGSERGHPKDKRKLGSLKLAMDRRHRFDLSVYDGQAIVRIDGTILAEIPFATCPGDVKGGGGGAQELSFGGRDLTFRISDLALGRDIHYEARNTDEFEIPEDNYVMMGDNVRNSHDSRGWIRRTVTLKDGRPPVVCESMEYKESNKSGEALQRFMQRYGLKEEPDLFIENDENGSAWGLYRKDPGTGILKPGLPLAVIEEEKKPEPAYRIPGKFIVGKALWVWYPMGRWFSLIR